MPKREPNTFRSIKGYLNDRGWSEKRVRMPGEDIDTILCDRWIPHPEFTGKERNLQEAFAWQLKIDTASSGDWDFGSITLRRRA
jgi:hypothetical protein